MFRDLLVHVDGIGETGNILPAAIDIATSMGARLTGLHIVPGADTPAAYKPSRVEEAIAQARIRLQADGRAAELQFRAQTAGRLADIFGRKPTAMSPRGFRRAHDLLIWSSSAKAIGRHLRSATPCRLRIRWSCIAAAPFLSAHAMRGPAHFPELPWHGTVADRLQEQFTMRCHS